MTEPGNLVVEKREEMPVTVNAFELISKSQGLDLGTLFEKQMGLVKSETRFTSKCSANEILSKTEEAAMPLGFNVLRRFVHWTYKAVGHKVNVLQKKRLKWKCHSAILEVTASLIEECGEDKSDWLPKK